MLQLHNYFSKSRLINQLPEHQMEGSFFEKKKKKKKNFTLVQCSFKLCLAGTCRLLGLWYFLKNHSPNLLHSQKSISYSNINRTGDGWHNTYRHTYIQYMYVCTCCVSVLAWCCVISLCTIALLLLLSLFYCNWHAVHRVHCFKQVYWF